MTTNHLDPLRPNQEDAVSSIASLINQFLPETITPIVYLEENKLNVVLEAKELPDQNILIHQIKSTFSQLDLELIQQVTVYGRERGNPFPIWQEKLDLLNSSSTINIVTESYVEPESITSLDSAQEDRLQEQPKSESSLFSSMFGAVAGVAGAVGGAAVYAGETVTGAAGALGSTALQAGGAITGAVTGTAGAVGGAAVYAGETITGTVVGAAGAVGNAAVQTGNAIAGTTLSVAGAIANTAMQATDGVGYVLELLKHSPQLQDLTKNLQVDQFIHLIDRVDIVKAETHVKHLQRQYPAEKPSDIAHRIMLEKALYVGGTGFASSLVPGFASALFAVDLAATMALQAEMIYQIAGAYGLSLQEPARKGEVLAIFGMSLGGNFALKAGLGLVRNMPVAGAVVGASSNAAMLYALGYAACRFYEAKLGTPTSGPQPAAAPDIDQTYLQDVLNQQVIFDQILIHLIQAGQPKKTLKELLPDLQTLNLPPAFLAAMIQTPQILPPLDHLLSQLNQDFATSLLAQCQKIAHSDGVITPQEAKVLKAIEKACGTRPTAKFKWF